MYTLADVLSDKEFDRVPEHLKEKSIYELTVSDLKAIRAATLLKEVEILKAILA
jgi:hypothetical protein